MTQDAARGSPPALVGSPDTTAIVERHGDALARCVREAFGRVSAHVNCLLGKE
jgi:hypothetical protein